jgi:hypothetical protein
MPKPPAASSLWFPVVAPAVWGGHFTVTYIAIALACSEPGAPFAGSARTLVTMFSAVAIAIILWCFGCGAAAHDGRGPWRSYDEDTPEDRRHFMAMTTMLLAGLSLIGSAFVTAAALAPGGCG